MSLFLANSLMLSIMQPFLAEPKERPLVLYVVVLGRGNVDLKGSLLKSFIDLQG